MRGKWLAVTLTGNRAQPGERQRSFFAYLAEQSIKVAEVTRNGADVFMRVTSRHGLKKIEDLARQHDNVRTAFAN